MQNVQTKPHEIFLSDRSLLNVTGVEKVLQFNDRSVTLKTAKGTLAVDGEGLSVSSLSVGDGRLSVSGKIDRLCYRDGGGLKRLLK